MGMKSSGYIERIKRELVVKFDMMNIRSINFYLGLKVKRDHQKQILKLSQLVYINKILIKYHLKLIKLYNILIKEVIFLLNEG